MSEDYPPVLETLDSQMRCCMFSNSNGDVMIVHEQPLASDIQWVEFHVVTGALNLVHEDGRVQPLGVELSEKATKNISHGDAVSLVCFDENKVISSYQTTVMIIQED